MEREDVWGDDEGEFGSAWPLSSRGSGSTSSQRRGAGARGAFERRQASVTGAPDWDAWGSLRSAATPTVRPAPTVRPPAPAPAPAPAPRAAASSAASRAASAHPAMPKQQVPATNKPPRGWGTIPAVQPVHILSPPQEETANDVERKGPTRASEQADRYSATGNSRGTGTRETRADATRTKEDGFGITPQQLSAIKRSFGQFAEGGLMPGKPVTFVSLDPRNLGEACRSLKLQHPLIDADVRAIVGSRQTRRAREPIDLLEFTKLVAARLVKIGAGRPKDPVVAPAPAPVRKAVPVTIAPWVKTKESGETAAEPATNASPANTADFPMLGVIPVPPAETQPPAEEAHTLRLAASQKQTGMVAPPAGTLAQRQVDAALARKAAGPSRGWEKPVATVQQGIDTAGPSLQEAYKAAPDQNQKGKSKTAERKARMNEPATLDTFWGNIVVSKSSQKQTKIKKKKEAASDTMARKGKTVNPNKSSGEMVAKRGVQREKAKKKKMSKLKRIILQERERKYLDQLAYRRVACVLASRAMKKRLRSKARGDDTSQKELRAKILAADVACYMMSAWLTKKRKLMVAEIESLKGMKSSLGKLSGTSSVDSTALHKTVASSVESRSVGDQDSNRIIVDGQVGEDSATEDDDEAVSQAAVGPPKMIVPAGPPKIVVTASSLNNKTGSGTEDSGTEDSATEDSATEDSATEDEDEPSVDPETMSQVVVVRGESLAGDEGNSATEDSATEEDDDLTPPASSRIAEPEPEPEPEPQKYRPRAELSARPHGIRKVTFGNLPPTVRWPQLKSILLERCGPIEHSRLFNDNADFDGSRRCVVNFGTVEAIDAAVTLMGIELFPGHPVKVDFNERRGPWEWLPEPKEGEDPNQKKSKVKKIQDEPIESAQQAAERRLKIPRIAPPEMRSYCRQSITPELNKSVSALLAKLKGFQDRLKATDPLKAKMRRRFVLGLREVRRGVMARKVKAVIMTPNIEQVESKGGLDTFVGDIIEACAKDREDGDDGIEIDQIPVVFALTRNKLGKALGKPMTLSVVGLYDVNGAYEEYKEMVRLAEEGRVLWAQEQARAREPKPAPAPQPAADAAAEPEPEPAAQTSSKPKGSAGSNSVEAPRLNANAPVFFTPVYPVPTPGGRTIAAAAPQFTRVTPNFGYAPPLPVPPPMSGTSLYAPFPMGAAPMMNRPMRSTAGHSSGNRSNDRGQNKSGSNGIGVGSSCSEGDIASIVAGLVGKLHAGTVVGTAVGDKTTDGKGATAAAGSAGAQQ